ncbi:MAG: hypothetical protein WBD33_00235 [Xanthobacteraceae bacterium]
MACSNISAPPSLLQIAEQRPRPLDDGEELLRLMSFDVTAQMIPCHTTCAKIPWSVIWPRLFSTAGASFLRTERRGCWQSPIACVGVVRQHEKARRDGRASERNFISLERQAEPLPDINQGHGERVDERIVVIRTEKRRLSVSLFVFITHVSPVAQPDSTMSAPSKLPSGASSLACASASAARSRRALRQN